MSTVLQGKCKVVPVLN